VLLSTANLKESNLEISGAGHSWDFPCARDTSQVSLLARELWRGYGWQFSGESLEERQQVTLALGR
jgi:hypothetical protein